MSGGRVAPPPPGGSPGPYAALVDEMLRRHGLRVRRWRTTRSGIAVLLRHADGRMDRWIESCYPRGPVSLAIFLHEIAHHAIGLGRYRPRCLEEWHAWRWAVDEMRARGIAPNAAVERRMRAALMHAVDRGRRAGMRRIPALLRPFDRADPSARPQQAADGDGHRARGT